MVKMASVTLAGDETMCGGFRAASAMNLDHTGEMRVDPTCIGSGACRAAGRGPMGHQHGVVGLNGSVAKQIIATPTQVAAFVDGCGWGVLV